MCLLASILLVYCPLVQYKVMSGHDLKTGHVLKKKFVKPQVSFPKEKVTKSHFYLRKRDFLMWVGVVTG